MMMHYLHDPLSTKDLSEAFEHLDKAMAIFTEKDPQRERSSQANRIITSGYNCYRELYKQKKKEKKMHVSKYWTCFLNAQLNNYINKKKIQHLPHHPTLRPATPPPATPPHPEAIPGPSGISLTFEGFEMDTDSPLPKLTSSDDEDQAFSISFSDYEKDTDSSLPISDDEGEVGPQ